MLQFFKNLAILPILFIYLVLSGGLALAFKLETRHDEH